MDCVYLLGTQVTFSLFFQTCTILFKYLPPTALQLTQCSFNGVAHPDVVMLVIFLMLVKFLGHGTSVRVYSLTTRKH